MKISYTPTGVCSKQINIEVDENNIIQSVEYIGGCNGNLKGIGELVKGMTVEEVINRLKNIKCGYKNTSCPAQLAKALEENFLN